MPSRTSQLPSPESLEWSVRARVRIAPLLLECYRALHARLGKPLRPVDNLILLTSGAAFSLWRAAFLAESDRDPNTMLDHAVAFFASLTRDNAIAFPQDRDNKAWTAGYYINNAYYRLSFIGTRLRADFPNDRLEYDITASCDLWLGGQHRYEKPHTLQDAWTEAYNWTQQVLDHLLTFSPEAD